MIYHKNFLAISNARRGKTRFESLFNLLDINELLIEEKDLLHKIISIPNADYYNIDEILEKEKVKSLEWLRNVLIQEKSEKKSIYKRKK